MKHFHAHIYFAPKDIEHARNLAKYALLIELFESVKFHERPIGPHPTGMIEMHFGDSSYTSAVEWIETHRGVFSVLIHQDTGDDFRDHSDGIRWLGKKLPLDFAFFELVQSHPELRVHQ